MEKWKNEKQRKNFLLKHERNLKKVTIKDDEMEMREFAGKHGFNWVMFESIDEMKKQLTYENKQSEKINTLSGKEKTQVIWEIACGDDIRYWSDYFRDFIRDEVEKLNESRDAFMSDYREEFTRNVYRYGFIKDGYPFVTGYTGIAGEYWQDSFPYTLCEADELYKEESR